jgi:hypothetical protein
MSSKKASNNPGLCPVKGQKSSLGTHDIKIQHMCIPCWIPKAIDINLTICNAECFSSATVSEKMHLNVMLYIEHLTCCTLCCSVSGPHCFKRSQYLHLQVQPATENEATMLGATQQTSEHYIPEDLIH